mgnify:CR=1 FL=1
MPNILNALNLSPHGLQRLLVWTVVATFILIALGASVRVADAGLSCPDWPLCYGQWLPFPAPEGGYVAEGVTYSLTQVLLEWGHRLLAAVVGFMFIAVLFSAWRLRRENSRFFPLALAAFLVLFVQIKLGGLTVILDNVNWSVAVHLGNAIVFYALLLLLLMAAIRPSGSKGITADFITKSALWAAPIMVYITMLLGAMVSTSHGGGVCGGLFDCAGRWWPTSDPIQSLHMLHRYAAFLTLLTAIAVFAATRHASGPLAKTGRIFLIFTLIQGVVGVVVLYSFSHYAWAYQALSVFHLAWGTVLFTVALTGVVKLYWGGKDPNAKTLPGHP